MSASAHVFALPEGFSFGTRGRCRSRAWEPCTSRTCSSPIPGIRVTPCRWRKRRKRSEDRGEALAGPHHASKHKRSSVGGVAEMLAVGAEQSRCRRRSGRPALPQSDKGSHARLAVDTCPGQHDHRTLDPRSPPCRKSPHASPPSARGPVANQKRREVAGRWSKHKSVGSRRSVLGRLETGDCASDEPGASSPVGAGAGTRLQQRDGRGDQSKSRSRAVGCALRQQPSTAPTRAPARGRKRSQATAPDTADRHDCFVA